MPRLHGYRYFKFVDANWMIDDEPHKPGDKLETISLERYAIEKGVTVDAVIAFAEASCEVGVDVADRAATTCSAHGHPTNGLTLPERHILPCIEEGPQLRSCERRLIRARAMTKTIERSQLVIINVICHHKTAP